MGINQTKRAMRAALAGLFIGVGSFSLGGCTNFTTDQAAVLRDQAAALHTRVQEEVTQLEHLRESFMPGTIEHSELDAAVAATKARAQAIQAAIQRADLVIGEARHPTDGLTILSDQFSPWLPGPARAPLLLGAALLATLARARQLKKGAGSIALSLEKAMLMDQDLRLAFERNAPTVRSVQTPTAMRIVDESTKPGQTLVRLPI